MRIHHHHNHKPCFSAEIILIPSFDGEIARVSLVKSSPASGYDRSNHLGTQVPHGGVWSGAKDVVFQCVVKRIGGDGKISLWYANYVNGSFLMADVFPCRWNDGQNSGLNLSPSFWVLVAILAMKYIRVMACLESQEFGPSNQAGAGFNPKNSCAFRWMLIHPTKSYSGL